MLPRSRRLSRANFPDRGRTLYSSPFFSVKISRGAGSLNRFGVVISARAIPTAAKRHELKRRILARAGIFKESGLDILFFTRGAAAGLTRKQLSQEIDKIKDTIEL